MFSLHQELIYTQGIQDVLEGLLLPVPEKGQAYITSDKGNILFISSHGCAVRITEQSHVLEKEHIHLLRPLFSRYADGYRIDVNPGLENPVPFFKALKLYLYYRRAGLKIADPRPDNSGFIPGTRFPVVLDIDSQQITINFTKATDQLSANLERLKKWLGCEDLGLKTETIDPQDYYYGDLRTRFAKAWPLNHDRPDRALMLKAWRSCREAKQDGRLISAWENYNYCGSSKKAESYARALEGPESHFS